MLLKFIVGENDPMQLVQVETKEDGKMQVDFYHFLPFTPNNYGILILNFWDRLTMDKHVELLNELVHYWDSVGQPRGLLEALFYSAFENDLVYPDALTAWQDQELSPCRGEEWMRGVVKKQADIRLSNTVFQIQDFLSSIDYEWSVCYKQPRDHTSTNYIDGPHTSRALRTQSRTRRLSNFQHICMYSSNSSAVAVT